jgi:hypothetical protein
LKLGVENSGVENSGVEKSGVENSGVEMPCNLQKLCEFQLSTDIFWPLNTNVKLNLVPTL